jgi:hypothetical protein
LKQDGGILQNFKQMKKIVKNPIFQRVCYIIALVMYFLLLRKDIVNHPFLSSSFSIPYFYLWLVPSIVLLYQCVFNNFLGWLSIFLLYVFIFISTFVNFLIEMIGAYGVKYVESDFVSFIGLYIIFTSLIGLFIYLLKPIKKTKI